MIGETFGSYRVTGKLGEGGMGAVYLAEHPFMGRKAAVKVLRREFAEDTNLVERFMKLAATPKFAGHPLGSVAWKARNAIGGWLWSRNVSVAPAVSGTLDKVITARRA